MKQISNILPLISMEILVLAPKTASACSVCFHGSPDDPANKALRAGVLAMLILVVFILGLFASFFIRLMIRAKKMG